MFAEGRAGSIKKNKRVLTLRKCLNIRPTLTAHHGMFATGSRLTMTSWPPVVFRRGGNVGMTQVQLTGGNVAGL